VRITACPTPLDGVVLGGARSDRRRQGNQPAPGFEVLRRVGEATWEPLDEMPRKRTLPVRAARKQAILDASVGSEGDQPHADVRREWIVALDWDAVAA
jgi:hypothetical protein